MEVPSVEKQTKLLNVVQSDEPYREKLHAVEEFLGSPVADYLLDKCPRVWEKIQKYYGKLDDLVHNLESIKEIRLKLQDPNILQKEKLQLEQHLNKTINYIETLQKIIKQLEKEIEIELKNCISTGGVSSIQVLDITLTAHPEKSCPELGKLLEKMDEIVGNIESHLKRYPFGSPWLMAHLGFIGYTDHGIGHIERVLKNAEKIALELGVNLNALEKAILKIAVYYHDYALNFLPSFIEEKLPKLDRDEIRKEHASFAAQQWVKKFEEEHESTVEKYVSKHDVQKIKDAVGEVIENHSGDFNHYTDRDIHICGSKVPIRVKLLSAILRLADEMDAGYYRLPQKETIGSVVVLGLCDDEYVKSLSHYLTNALIDSIDIKNRRLEILMHPLKDVVVFYPRDQSKRALFGYTQEELEPIEDIIDVSHERKYVIRDIFVNKLKDELHLVNSVFSSYGLPEIEYKLDESIPLDVATRFDRDLTYRGFQSFIKMGIGKKLLDSCEDWKKIKSEEDIYITLRVR